VEDQLSITGGLEMKKTMISFAMMLLLAVSAWAGSGPAMNEGQWEMTIETEMQGMPMKMPPITFSQCITEQDPVPQGQQPGQQCAAKDVVTKGNTVTWTIECDTPGGKSTGKGKVTYDKDTMEGSMTMSTQGMEMTTRFKGKRLGPCQQ
jgi:hypothetical protein